MNSWRANFYEKDAITNGAYLEALVPLAKKNAFPLLHELELQLSGRVDHYTVDTGTQFEQSFFNQVPQQTVYGGITKSGQPYFAEASYSSHNYTAGLKWQPMDGLVFRFSHATAFLPPTPAQLIKDTAPETFTTEVMDPRNGLVTPVFTVGGGNPDLKPQNSESLNLGIIWQPKWKALEGLRLNAEYYKITQFDAITGLSAQGIVSQETLYPGRVTRNAAGTITEVDVSLLNLYRHETEGWDLSVDYSRKTGIGRFTLTAAQSIILHLKTQFSLTEPEYDTVGFHWNESVAGAPKYKSNLMVNWEWRGWAAGWSTRYFHSYKVLGAAGGPTSRQDADGGVSGNNVAAQGSDSVASQSYHDLFVGYSFGRGGAAGVSGHFNSLRRKLASDLTIQIGLRNAFDKAPPLDSTPASSYYYFSPYGDLRLRSYWLSVRKGF